MDLSDTGYLLEGWNEILDALGLAYNLQLRHCVALASPPPKSFLYWVDFEQRSEWSSALHGSTLFPAVERLALTCPPHSILRIEAFREWLGREPNAVEAQALERLRPFLLEGDVGAQIFDTYVQALDWPGEGGALAHLGGMQDAWEAMEALEASEESIPDVAARLTVPEEWARTEALIRAALVEVDAVLDGPPQCPSHAFGQLISLAAKKLLLFMIEDLCTRPHDDRDLSWLHRSLSAPLPAACWPTPNGLGHLPSEVLEEADTQAECALDLRAAMEESQLEFADWTMEGWDAGWDSFCESRPAWELPGLKWHMGERAFSRGIARFQVFNQTLEHYGRRLSDCKSLFKLAYRFRRERDRSSVWPFDPLSDFLVAAVPQGMLLIERPIDVIHDSRADMLMATETLVSRLSSVLTVASGAPGTPSRVFQQLAWRSALDLPSPIGRAYHRFTSEQDPARRLLAAKDFLITVLRVLGAVAAAEVQRLGRGSDVSSGQKVGLAKLLERPSEGDWWTVARWPARHVPPDELCFSALHRTLGDDEDLSRAIERLITWRNRHVGHGVTPSTSQLRSTLPSVEIDVVLVAERLARAFGRYALIRAGAFVAIDRTPSQRISVLRGRQDPPDVVDVSTDSPIVTPERVALVCLETGRVLSLDPFLVSHNERMLAWSAWSPSHGHVRMAPVEAEGADEAVDSPTYQFSNRLSEVTLTHEQLQEAFPAGWLRVPSGELLNGRFRILDRVGFGGTADVYRSEDVLSGKHVAVKVLYEHMAQDPAFCRRFRLEAQLQMKIASPNILPVLTQEEDRDRPIRFLVMELADYDLASRLPQLVRDVEAQRRVLLDVASALAAIHGYDLDRPVVHRDLKPDNVFWADGRWKLGDFGVAFEAADRRLTRVAVYTPEAYRAPEALQGRRPTPAIDVYAFGRLTLALALGRDPAPDADRRAAAHLPWANVVDRCLRPQAEDRYSTGQEVLEALRALG